MVKASSARFAPNAWQTRNGPLRAVIAALLFGAGVARAADTQETAAQRALDLSLPVAALAKPCARAAPRYGCTERKPYGIGYEARRSIEAPGIATAAPHQPSGASVGVVASGSSAGSVGPGATGNRSGAGRHGRR